MSKADNAKNTLGTLTDASYGILIYADYDDGTSDNFTLRFPLGTKDWNRGALTVPKKKPIKAIRLYPLFRGNNTGTVWYDDIRITEGNVLTQQSYDNNDRVSSSTDENGKKTTFTYDEYGNQTSVTDPKGYQKNQEYNLDNQLTKTTLQNQTSVSYQYDDNGNTTQKTITANGKSQVVKYEYDVDNKVTRFIDPLNRQIDNVYDANANLIKTSMPNGSILEWTYDTADRVKELKRNGTVAFTYEYDANGNETKVTDSVNSVVRSKQYDSGNRISSMTDRGGTVSWSYLQGSDKLNTLNIVQGTVNKTTTFEYNALNQNTKVTDEGKSYYFDYDEFGNVATYQAGNTVATRFGYDATQKVKDINIVKTDGTVLASENYGYDDNGNRTSVERITSTGSSKSTYAYDSINQLTNETLSDGTVYDYTYDGFGNRTGVTVTKPGFVPQTTLETFNNGNQLTSYGNEAITYDANGNRLSDAQFTYTWNATDQLIAVTRKGETTAFATYKYDDDGRRIEKTVNGTTTRFYYDGDSINVLYETDANGTFLRQYIYNVDGVRMAMKAQGQILYYHYNPHGDVVTMTDQSGNVVAKYEYDAWGNVISQNVTGMAADNPFGYAGYMYDKETSMYYLIARYYHPKHGVFISMDPDSGDDDDPITQNGYTYADNNPINMIDKDGNRSKSIKDRIVYSNRYKFKIVRGEVPFSPGGGPISRMAKEAKRVGAILNTKTIKGFTKAWYSVPGKAGGQSRAVYVKFINPKNKTVKFYKDTFTKDNRFYHRKFKKGGPSGERR
ncbi:RHS repeat-associated core domain-containing protein [Neobacillus cucumis]|nr:RHS repeat-associated core domain-containing protein [Neobacillus cucumis]